MRARWRREPDQQDADTAVGLTCRYWPNLQRLGVECGKPATHSYETISRGTIPVCTDCVMASAVLMFAAKPLHECEGCHIKMLSPGRCVSCFMDWVSPKVPA